VLADLGALPPDPEYQVGAGMDRREARDPDVLEESQHGQLALLVNQRVVGQDREIEEQLRPPGSR
jgi:hypothetical protein